MNFHLGKTRYPGCFRFHRTTIWMNGKPNQDVFFEHPIRWWFGISFARLFIGIVRTEPTRDVRARPSREGGAHGG